MRSKAAAAEMASESGIAAVICDGTAAGTLSRAAAGEQVGHPLRAQPTKTSSFKLWLRYGKPARGRLAVDEGAAKVLREKGSSLLPVGITAVEGSFEAGEAVEVVVDGEVVGKGIGNYSAEEMRRIQGLKSAAGARADAPRRRGGGAPRLLRARLSGCRHGCTRQAAAVARSGYPLLPMATTVKSVAASCAAAKQASRAASRERPDAEAKDAALRRAAELLAERSAEVLEANAADLADERAAGLSGSLRDRLTLDEERVRGDGGRA